MEIWHGQAEVPSDLDGCVVTIGVFDGIHRGHQELIKQAVAHARRLGVPAVLTTFDPHPVAVFLPQQTPPQLTSMRQRLQLAEELGIDKALIIDFTRELAGLSPELYFSSLIQDTLKAKAIYVGENFSFGKNAEGTSTTLRELGEKAGIDTHVVELIRDAGEVLCSSLVREHLENGEIPGATEILGRPFSITAKIVHGAGRGGKQLGFPTANQYFPDTVALPGDGVYAAWFTIVDTGQLTGTMERNTRYMAAVSVGTNPTFGSEPRSVESFVLDQDTDLYGHTATVEFVEKIRDMVKFNSVEELKETITKDVEKTRSILEKRRA